MAISNEWFAGESEAEGMQIITRGRMFLQSLKESGRYPVRMEIQWVYRSDSKGMPLPEETDLLEKSMNLLTDVLEEASVAVLTAVYIGAGQALYVYYTGQFREMSALINKTWSDFPELPIKIGMGSDPEWSDYLGMLDKFGIK